MPHQESYRRILYKMGYYDYQSGLIHRHLNQGSGWNFHLGKCRDFILKAVELTRPGKITILGSGWLLDVPLAELIEKTEKVYLADIVHPPEVYSQTAAMKNVEIIEQDLSGGLIDELWRKTRGHYFFNRLKTLNAIKITEFSFSFDPGLVVSMNILTQLEILPERYLRKNSVAGEKEFSEFRRNIQQKHLQSLSGFDRVIITDTSEVFSDLSGDVSEKKTLVAPLPDATFSEEWTWDFDLKSSDYNRSRSVLNVTAKMYLK